ncbi:MAG TPA: hemolysin family protein [Spirochaetota bacterium]|nr:hemolysin family protein [Spirochaetota bacterium]HOM38177.1 hemolysin family protein [Spirochaetota bacterium]HPQ48605.1 hemolysin family protein [Spirochaetota bacterium]
MKLSDLFKKREKFSESLEIMIENIKKLKNKIASDIMIPRVDVISFSIGQKIESVIKTINSEGYSRYPVWKEKIDNIIGVLYVKDIFFHLSKSEDNLTIKKKVIEEDMIREALFIPETKKIESLLQDFKSKKVHMAIVLDEFGGFSGIVTLEDIIEIITGEIQDEYDEEIEPIREIEKNVYDIDARLTLEEIEEKLGLNFDDYKENVDTISGLIYNVIEKVPKIGEGIEINNVKYQITKKEGNKIIRLKLTITKKENE